MDIALPATIAFILAGLIKGVLGFGFPIIALILLTLYIGLLDALAIIVVPTLVTNIWQALSGSHLRAILQRMWLYFTCAMAGIFAASWFITEVDVNLLTGMLGVVLFFFAVSRLLDVHINVPQRREPVLSVLLGSVNGLLTGFTGSFMVPSVLYMQALGFGKDMLVQAMGVFFGLSTAMLMVSLGRNDLIGPEEAIASSVMLIPSFAGIYAGRWMRDRIDEATFQKAFLVGVLLLGAYIVYRAAMPPMYGPVADPATG
jgi:uncharacterized membrane protein YfcA